MIVRGYVFKWKFLYIGWLLELSDNRMSIPYSNSTVYMDIKNDESKVSYMAVSLKEERCFKKLKKWANKHLI